MKMKQMKSFLLVFSALIFSPIFSYSNTYDYPQTGTIHGATASKFIVADQGGVIETTDRDGTLYRLTLPPHALSIDMEVSIVPVLTKGISNTELSLGLDIKPAGTLLWAWAQVDIVPKVAIKKPIWFETNGDESSFISRPTQTTANGLSGLIYHFSGIEILTGEALYREIMGQGKPITNIQDVAARRDLIEQGFKTNVIDDKEYTQATELLLTESKTIAQQYTKDLLDKAEREAKAALERLKNRDDNMDLEATRQYIKQVQDLLMKYRAGKLLGSEQDLTEIYEFLLDYIESVLKNCVNQAYGPNFAMELIHMKNLLGAAYDPDDFELAQKCAIGWKSYKVIGEYVFVKKYKDDPVVGQNNVKDYFEFILNVLYNDKKAKIETEFETLSNAMTGYDDQKKDEDMINEGCMGSVTTDGDFEVFDYKKQYELSSVYQPAPYFPPGTPLPPGYKPIPAYANINIQIFGESRERGVIRTPYKPIPKLCERNESPMPTIVKKSHYFNFNPLKLAKPGDQMTENHRHDDSRKTEGWIYTIKRIKDFTPPGQP